MSAPTSFYRDQVLAELEAVPDEDLPFLARLIRTFRESVQLKQADASLHQGWQETRRGETYPLATLWNEYDSG